MNKSKQEKKDNSELRWFIIVFATTFVLSIIFSFISTNAISSLSVIPALIILIVLMLVGILFDIIGVAVTVANEHEFHAKATKKVEGSKTSIKLIRNSAKVANICADVIGDVCGVLSGAIAALVSMKMTESMNLEFNIQFIVSAIVASLTVSGKALGKGVAQRNSTKIVHIVGTILNKFNGEKKIKREKIRKEEINEKNEEKEEKEEVN